MQIVQVEVEPCLFWDCKLRDNGDDGVSYAAVEPIVEVQEKEEKDEGLVRDTSEVS